MMNREEKIDTIYRTLDWMDANPDKTIIGSLALDGEGKRCRPHKPEAECFCFLGRLCVEAGPEERLTTNDALQRWLLDLHVTPRVVSYINDQYLVAQFRLPALRKFWDKVTRRKP